MVPVHILCHITFLEFHDQSHIHILLLPLLVSSQSSMTTTNSSSNMTTISALERSLQNCSLSRSSTSSNGSGSTRNIDGLDHHHHHHQHQSNSTAITNRDAALELNSEISLPYQWEQCLDLETGEIYYVNWETGMKEREDPRRVESFEENYYLVDGEDFINNYSYSSDESSSVSSPSPSSSRDIEDSCGEAAGEHILIVAGCKSCLMYFMLPKWVLVCPKCSGFILHFDRFKSDSSSL
ncbi:hypothetical protein Scep_018273 [Stephania cephalantha]|uniref:WW domain-containing protein n=1 Tax=Stephania cephalantha TaxID=152367 RepID=A0AAP0IS42_9MAGN